MMKKIVSMILALTLLICLCSPALAASKITVYVDGTAVYWTDVEPFIDGNGRTMVPLRAVADAMGLYVTWDGDSREATFSGPAGMIIFTIGVSYATYVNDDIGNIQMDTSPVIVNDRTYAPIRYLAEFFGYRVDWNGATSTVTLTGTNSVPNNQNTPTLPKTVLLSDLEEFQMSKVAQDFIWTQEDNYGNTYLTTLCCYVDDGFIEYYLDADYDILTGTIFIPGQAREGVEHGHYWWDSASVKIYGDDQLLYSCAGEYDLKMKPIDFSIDVKGVEFLKIEFHYCYYLETGNGNPLVVLGDLTLER